MAGLAAAVTVHDGRVVSARAAYISMAPTPAVVDLTAGAPADPSAAADPAAWRDAAQAAVAGLEPEGDLHASAHYRAHLARTLTARAMAQAAASVTQEVPA